MKLKHKLMLAMISMALLLIFFNSFFVFRTVYANMFNEKCALYSELSEQVLHSFETVSDSVEISFFNSCKTDGIGNLLYLDKSLQVKRTQLTMKLLGFISNSENHALDACLVGLDDEFFFSQFSDEKQQAVFRSVYAQLDPRHDVQWLASGNDVYLCRSVYMLAPYEKQGYLLAKMNAGELCALAGMNTNGNGTMYVLEQDRTPILCSDGSLNSMDLSMWNEHRVWMRDENSDSHLYRLSTKRGDWSVAFRISHAQMMETYYRILRTMIIVSALLVALAVALALAFSHGMTKNITRLVQSIKAIHDGKKDPPIQVKGHDEVAELADKFNWLLASINEAHKTRYELLELKYRFIQSQISPHFMSNVLSSISSYSIMGKSDQMEELCIKTSRYLKHNLRDSEQRMVPVYQELTNVGEYVEIYRLISAVNVDFHVDCPEELMDKPMLSMILQPIVENALIHSTNAATVRDYQVTVRVYRQAEWLVIDVTDNGCGMTTEVLGKIEQAKAALPTDTAPGGFGIGAVIRRLHLQYGDTYRFEAQTLLNEGTTITIGFVLDP